MRSLSRDSLPAPSQNITPALLRNLRVYSSCDGRPRDPRLPLIPQGPLPSRHPQRALPPLDGSRRRRL
ncbi:hypothetical protein BD311DRAFT_769515 [Dichomitus squalens]|uniref:Uncharacterized protein n=1 Tax=Dichomitus squalens TaxID=114155 RepID=A0A4Q9M7H8_9APHY|nr:hypothetical protein BD311DRAFT_769515 [Dichomitus squalens]